MSAGSYLQETEMRPESTAPGEYLTLAPPRDRIPADRSASPLIEPAVALLRKEGKLRKGDRVAFLTGIPLTAAGGTNSLRVVTVK